MNRDDRYMLYALAAFAGILAFGTVSYFSVCFKKQFGVSPSEFQ